VAAQPRFPTTDDAQPPDNGPIYILYHIMHQVRHIVPQCTKHVYPANNSNTHNWPHHSKLAITCTASSIINDTIKQKHSKAMTCISTGSMTMHSKTNFTVRKLGNTNKTDFFQHTTLPLTIKPFAHNICMSLAYPPIIMQGSATILSNILVRMC